MKIKLKKKIRKIVLLLVITLLILNNLPVVVLANADLYENNRILPKDYVNISSLEKSTNNLSLLSSINSQVLGINAYDQKQYEDWLTIGKALLASKAENGVLWQKFEANGEELTPEITEELGVNWNTFSKFDIRMIESLNYLVAPKQNGGAGREWLAIPNITRGYNVLASKAYSGNTLKDKTGKEADQETIAKDDKALTYISAHSSQWGQAVDISQIDFLRGTVLAYDKDDKLVAKKKFNKQPIQVEWQTDYRPDENPFPSAKGLNWLPAGFSDFGKGTANTAFNNLVNMLGNENIINCQLPENNPQVNGDNLAQMVVINLGLVCYLQEQELPLNFMPGYDLEQSSIKLGQIITQNLSGKNLPASGLAGNNLKELEINIGKEWVGQSLGLPINTFQTYNSHDLIIAVGKNVLADKLNMLPGSLDNLAEGNTAEIIGRGYIEKILNLAPGTMAKNTLTEVKFNIGAEKADFIFGKPGMIDKFLDIEAGKTAQFLNGSISPQEYSRIVGQKQIDRINSAFPKKELLDSAFGISGGNIGANQFSNDLEKQKQWYLENYDFLDILVPEKNIKARDYFNNNFATEFYNNNVSLNNFLGQYAYPKNNNLMERFFSGDKNVFYDMGIRSLSRIFSSDSQMWPYYEEWLKEENDQAINALSDIFDITLPGRSDLPIISSDYLNSSFNLRAGDLERIFILDRAQEVFERMGNIKLIDSFNQKITNASSILEENPQSEINVFSPFYREKFSQISNEAKKIGSPQANSEITQIINLANEAVNYQEPSPQDIEKLSRITKYTEITDLMQKLLVDIAKKNPAGTDLEPLRENINDIIEGEDIANPLSFSKDQIKENYSDYYMVSGEFKNNIYEVVHGSQTPAEMAKNIGLETLANQILEHPDENILISANNRVKQNYQTANTALLENIASSGISGDEFAQNAADITNSAFSLSGDLLATKNDIINFLNGAYLSLAEKIGSHTANQAFKEGDFRGYINGNISPDTLRSQINVSDYSSETINSVLDLIANNANVFDVGMSIAQKNSGLDIAGFFKGTNSNFSQNVYDFTNSFFAPGEIADEEIRNTSNKLLNSLIFGNFRDYSDIYQALSTSRMYKKLYPEAGFQVSDFLPKSTMTVIKEHRDDVGFILNLSKPGFLANYMKSGQLQNMAGKLFSKALAEKLGDDNLAYGALNNLFNLMQNSNFSQSDAISAFQGYLNQSGFLDKISADIRPLFTTALSSKDFGPGTVSSLLTSLVNSNKGLTDKEKTQMTAVLSFSMNQDYSFDNFTALYNSFSKDPMDPKVAQGLSLVGDIYQDRNFDFTRIPDLIDSFSDKPMNEKDRASLSLLSDLYQNHNFNFAKLPDFISKFSDKPMDEKTKAGLLLVTQIYQNKGQNFDFTQLPNLINSFSDTKLTDKQTSALNLATNIYKNGNFDYTQLPTLISKFSAKSLNDKQMVALNLAVNTYKNGNFDFTQLPNLINSFSDTKLTNTQTAALSVLGDTFGSKEITPRSISKLVTSFDIFKDSNLTDTQKSSYTNLLAGTIDMAFSHNLDPVRIVGLGFNAAGINSINIDGLGPISLSSLLSSYKNPQALLGSIASDLFSNALVGALGLTSGGLPAIFVSAIAGSLISGLLGGGKENLRYEYYYTACGFYPKFDKEEKIGEGKFVNELKLVNDAKSKAVASNTPEDWGEFVKLRVKYDTIPTDEINEDDANTQDGKYNQEALANEQTDKIAEYGLAQVIDEAKSKNNDAIQCMDEKNGAGGIFENGETPEISDSAKKQISQYKIKVLLGNLINMRNNTGFFRENNYFATGGGIAYNIINQLTKNYFISSALAADTIQNDNKNQKYTRILNFNYSQKDLRPTQIMTFEPEDVKHFYVMRDKYWGDTYGSPGSQDIILAGNIIREGFGYNKKMWDRIHYGY